MILSIESSCDDSSIALTEIATNKLILHKKISQENDHSAYGGVVPELASRLHATALPKILEDVLPLTAQIKAVAVTTDPGLSVTLLEGIAMAKAVSISLDIPLIAINHLQAHIHSLFIEKQQIDPLLVLLISGGHTQIIKYQNGAMKLLATTLDDSVGESFDKVAKMLDLGYPGGPIVEEYAKRGDKDAVTFPVPLSGSPKLAFSLSGLKNAVRLEIEKNQNSKEDICASFQHAVTKHLLQKSKKIFKSDATKDFAIVGGASANQTIRQAYEELCKQYNKTLHLAPLEFCSDNAAMVGRLGVEKYKQKAFSKLEDIDANDRSS
ncbi:MAG: tRNA (adenosine(37)-N6)-threonylcarbamoyltransferase complex transferase subunit TsaD [Campylobacterota bacterium]